MADTFAEIKAIIIDLLGVDEEKITPEARFREDLEADSLDLVELIMAFEDKFGGEISDEDAQKITTVGDAVRYVETHMG
jgi:acyl carrier protein